MANTFEFDAPQYLDFNEGLDESDEADKFFDVESETPTRRDDNKENQNGKDNSVRIKEEVVSTKSTTTDSKMNIKTEPESPETEQNKSSIKPLSIEKSNMKREMLKAVRRLSGLKKELPIATVEPLCNVDEVSKDEIRGKKRVHYTNIKEEKSHQMTTREDQRIKTPRKQLRNRTIELVLDEEKENRKRKPDVEFSKVPKKYVAMAEQLLHFQRDTPPRFRRNKRRSSVSMQVNMLKSRKSYNPRRTIALTPKLMTTQRSRPVEVLSQEQKEALEFEEMKKYQVKAHPFNEKILQPPILPKKMEKVMTVAEPFNLTKVLKKAQECKEEPYKFTAKSVPKAIFQRPVGLGSKPEVHITVPQSPAITKSARHQKPIRMEALSVNGEHGTVLMSSTGVPYTKHHEKTTEIKPFSFDSRDQEMIERKQKKIQEILEAEKKLREFKANPPPVFNPPKESNRPSKHCHLDCSKTSTSSVDVTQQPFKARSPRVLRQPKFEVNLLHIHSQPLNIELATERRTKERLEFEIRQQEKQEQIAAAKEKMEYERKKKEAEEIARIRMEAVHKALPMPKFNALPNKINSQIPLTEPHSPRFTKRSRGDKLCSNQYN